MKMLLKPSGASVGHQVEPGGAPGLCPGSEAGCWGPGMGEFRVGQCGTPLGGVTGGQEGPDEAPGPRFKGEVGAWHVLPPRNEESGRWVNLIEFFLALQVRPDLNWIRNRTV